MDCSLKYNKIDLIDELDGQENISKYNSEKSALNITAISIAELFDPNCAFGRFAFTRPPLR